MPAFLPPVLFAIGIMVAITGGRNVVFLTSVLLLLPALGTGYALSSPDLPFSTYIILATLSGIGERKLAAYGEDFLQLIRATGSPEPG